MKRPIILGTVFSGIGAIEFAFKRLGIPYEIAFACDNGEREVKYDVKEERKKISKLKAISEKTEYIRNLYLRLTKKTNYIEHSYLLNYKDKINKDKFYEDIYLLDGKDYKGKIDIFVGGSPCQSFSTVGKQLGLNDTRGTLFYEFARLLKEIQPKVFIYENVRGLLTNNNGRTFISIYEILNEILPKELHYNLSYDVLNAKDFNVPQNRNRLIIVGTKSNTGFDIHNIPKKRLTRTMQDFLEDNCKDGKFNYNKSGDLIIHRIPGKPNPKANLSPLVTKYVLKGGTKGFYTKPVTDLKIARPLLKTMGNHHRAGIDNYITVDKDKKLYRALTPRECLRLMGFTDDFIIDVPWSKMYMQAGNSIVVDVLIAILKELYLKER